jgi:5,10-methylenetetrahydromethanopterin reductase
MDIGLLCYPQEAGRFVDTARAAERAGFDLVGVADSQALLQELHTSLGVAAGVTDTVELGPTVTNPVTRHPAVTAGALCTLDAHTGGRAVLGIATGDHAVRTLGLEPATLRELRRFVERFRALTRGDTVEFEDEPVELAWLDRAREVPVVLTAEGPATLGLAGTVADRALIGTGVTPPVVEAAVERVREGAREAGRDPDDVSVWLYSRVAVTDGSGAPAGVSRDRLLAAVAASAHHALQFTFEGKAVPAEYEEPIRTLLDEYDPDQHASLGGSAANGRLVERLGLADYLTDRFALTGSVRECRERVDALADLGVEGLLLNPVGDTADFVDRFEPVVG